MNFEASNLMVNFAKETKFVPGSSMISKPTVSPTLAVLETGLKERVVDLAALLLMFWRCWAIYTEKGIAMRMTKIKPNKNIFLYDEKMDIFIPEIIVYRKEEHVNPN